MNTKTCGVVLLWLGFVSGALATVWKAPGKGVEFAKTLKTQEQVDQLSRENSGSESSKQKFKIVADFVPNDLRDVKIPEDGWHLVNWNWYGVSLAIGIAGIVLIRLDAVTAKMKSEETQAHVIDLQVTLSRLATHVEQLAKESKVLPPSQILHRIDDELNQDFLSFAESRDSITVEYGLSVYADVMSNFASGERAVNRAWSAAADGYVNEAENCLERAAVMLQSASEILHDRKND